MKIENQVCSLEQAIKMKKLGVGQHSYFKWYDGFLGWKVVRLDRVELSKRNPDKVVPAFTAAELLFINHETITINTLQLANSAEALADHLIGRIERGDISIDEINARL